MTPAPRPLCSERSGCPRYRVDRCVSCEGELGVSLPASERKPPVAPRRVVRPGAHHPPPLTITEDPLKTNLKLAYWTCRGYCFARCDQGPPHGPQGGSAVAARGSGKRRPATRLAEPPSPHKQLPASSWARWAPAKGCRNAKRYPGPNGLTELPCVPRLQTPKTIKAIRSVCVLASCRGWPPNPFCEPRCVGSGKHGRNIGPLGEVFVALHRTRNSAKLPYSLQDEKLAHTASHQTQTEASRDPR